MRGLGIPFILTILLFVSSLPAQGLEVNNVQFRQWGEFIIVSYDIIGPAGKKCTVEIEASDDYGTTFHLHPATVTGDVGKGVLPGSGKQIRWEYTHDYPGGLEGEGFVF